MDEECLEGELYRIQVLSDLLSLPLPEVIGHIQDGRQVKPVAALSGSNNGSGEVSTVVDTHATNKKLRSVCMRMERLLWAVDLVIPKIKSRRRIAEKVLLDVFLEAYGLDGTLEPKSIATLVRQHPTLSKDQVEEILDDIWVLLRKRESRYSNSWLRAEVGKMQQLANGLAISPEEVFTKYFFCES